MKRVAVLNALTTKNTSGSTILRSQGVNASEGPPGWSADLSLSATFGAGASSLAISFEGSADGTHWEAVQAFDLTTTGGDLVETKTITAACTRRLLRCVCDFPWMRAAWALTADNDATMLRLNVVHGVK